MNATVRRGLWVLLAVLGADVLLVLCAGVSPLGGAGVRGLAVRLAVAAALLAALPVRRRALWQKRQAARHRPGSYPLV